MKKRIAILASGEGTNAENIIKYFQKSDKIEVALVLYNRAKAGVKERAERLGIPMEYVPKKNFLTKDITLPLLERYKIDSIILAGFLLFIPDFLLEVYPKNILNIHPSLLPKYGGKNMYGDKVHEAVVANHEKETGITIHLVTAEVDAGEKIFQTTCKVLPNDSSEEVAQKVHKLEYKYYPEIIEQYCSK